MICAVDGEIAIIAVQLPHRSSPYLITSENRDILTSVISKHQLLTILCSLNSNIFHSHLGIFTSFGNTVWIQHLRLPWVRQALHLTVNKHQFPIRCLSFLWVTATVRLWPTSGWISVTPTAAGLTIRPKEMSTMHHMWIFHYFTPLINE